MTPPLVSLYTEEEFSYLSEVLSAVGVTFVEGRAWIHSWDNSIQRDWMYEFLTRPLDDMPLHINNDGLYPYKIVARWRLRIGR